MKIHSLILRTFLLLAFTGTAHTASFDCSKASSELEKLICSDDEFSKLDEALNKAYLEALKRIDTKKRTIETQRLWLKSFGAETDSARGNTKCSTDSLQ